jgi:hypothetical protein
VRLTTSKQAVQESLRGLHRIRLVPELGEGSLLFLLPLLFCVGRAVFFNGGELQGDLRGDCCWRCGRMRGADGEEVGLAAEGGDAVGVEDAGAVVIHQVGEFDFFSDHSISRYVDCVRAAVEEEEEVTRMIRPFRRQEPQPAKEISWPPMRRAA